MNMFQLVTVDLGVKKIQVPVAEIEGKNEGKRLLITAGLDGDEYASIEAAYKIIEESSSKKFRGHLTVIPILNIPGFEAKQSYNPLDNKFPKHVLFPGKNDDSPTERLMCWLSNNYLKNCNLWLDLHGGAITEALDSYLCMYETRNSNVNKVVRAIIRNINAPRVVFEKPKIWGKVELLAKKGIAYVIAEAGYGGKRSKIWIEKHIEWAEAIMSVLGMIDKSVPQITSPRIYRKIQQYKAKDNGLWYPRVSQNSFIQKGQNLGEIRSLDGFVRQKIRASQDGECLWRKKSMSCRKSETLIGIGCEMVNIAAIK